MGYWKRLIVWCQRPGMIKTQPFHLNLNIDEKHVIKNLLRLGSVIMGLGGFWLLNYPRIEELFLGLLFSGLGLMVLGIVPKVKEWFNLTRKTLLQTGVVYTIIWIIIYTTRIGGPIHIILYGYASVSIPVLMLGVYPTLGLISIALGIVPKENTETKIKSLRGRDMDRWKRFSQWYQRPDMIKIRRFSPSIAVAVMVVMQTVSMFVVIPGLIGPLVNISGINIPTNMAAADLLPSEVAGELLASGSIDTETLYQIVCFHNLVAEVADEDIENIKFQVEYTRAQYKGIVLHVFKVPPNDYSLQTRGVLQTLLQDCDWYGCASYFPKEPYNYVDSWFTTTKGGRSAYFFRSGVWIFGVDAENYLTRNRFARDLIQQFNGRTPQSIAIFSELGYIMPIMVVLIAVILGTSRTWGWLLGRISEKWIDSINLKLHRR